MSSKHRLIIEAPESTTQFKSICDLAPDSRQGAINLGNYIQSVPAGVRSANIKAQVGAVQASGSITFTGAPTAEDTCSIANVTFTAKSSDADGNEFDIDGGDGSAANLAAAINASSDLAGIVTASAAEGVVTLTAVVPGKIGDGLELSESLDNATATAFDLGADGTSYELDLD